MKRETLEKAKAIEKQINQIDKSFKIFEGKKVEKAYIQIGGSSFYLENESFERILIFLKAEQARLEMELEEL